MRSAIACFRVLGLSAIAAVGILTGAEASAQATKPTAQPAKPAAAPAAVAAPARAAAPPARATKEKIPAPVELGGNDLLTRDGVVLKATFFPSNKGKDAVPVILLHSWKGDRREYSALAPVLQQKAGHAVLVPDLRGHGESTQQQIGNNVRTLDAAKFNPADFGRMVQYDMETLKSFLMDKNNEGELNIEKLTVVGAEMGAGVALNWAAQDWSWPPLAGKKQGQDVKGLVLLSPEWSFRGLSARAAMNHPAVQSRLSVLIGVGERDAKAVAEAKRLYSVFERYHLEPPPEEATEKKDLFFGNFDTDLQGTKMLGRSLPVEAWIANFIQLRLVKQNFPWSDRSK